MNFMNSPFERMMKQKPRPQAPAQSKPPRGSRCDGVNGISGNVDMSAWKHYHLLPGTFESSAQREVRPCPANLPGRKRRRFAPWW